MGKSPASPRRTLARRTLGRTPAGRPPRPGMSATVGRVFVLTRLPPALGAGQRLGHAAEVISAGAAVGAG